MKINSAEVLRVRNKRIHMRQFNVVYTTIHVECTHKINNSCNMSYLDTADIKETVILENWLKVNLTSNKPVQPH
jgi:hypothetical protein